jgi:hypothetical protein
MFLRHLNPFYSPDDAPGAAPESMSISDMTEFLGGDDEPLKLEIDTETDDEELEEGKKETKEGDEEEKSLEDELEDELKDKTDDDEVVVGVRRKEVLAKYPNIFKEFPHLDKAVYREQKYAEMLPTLRDAKAAVDKADTLDKFQNDLIEGRTANILKAVKEEDPEAFNGLVDNYLVELGKVDQGAYYHVLGNVIKNSVIAMHNSQDEDTKTAAAILYKFFFNSDKFEPPTQLSTRSANKDEREKKIEEREQKFQQEQLETHINTVNTRVDNSIRSAIDKNIDPKQSMNDWQRDRAIKDCSEELESQIDKDVRFKGLLDKLWERAAENNFSQDSLDKIRSAYLSKAKGLLPEIIRSTRNKALRGLGRKSPDDRKEPLPVGRPVTGKKPESKPLGNGSSDKDKAKALPKGMKSVDFLMRD